MEEMRRIRRALIAKAAGLVSVMCAYVLFIVRRARQNTPRISYGPMSERDTARQSNLSFIYHTDDTNCLNQLRMRRAPFFQLCNLLRERQLLRDSIHSSVEEQVAMFLLVVGHNHRFRALQPTFRRSIETVSRYFREVLYAIGELRHEMITAPSSHTHLKITSNTRFNPYFTDCIGAIDGTHVDARVPSTISATFRGRKGVTTQNVMAAVDFDLRFTYVLAGWEGSAHDALILADAIERDNGLSVPPGNQLSMIVLDEEHYIGYVKDRAKDAEYLNVPLENYTQMAIIFGNGQATGRFAMGSNQALGNPPDMADSGLGPLDGIIGEGIAAGPSGVGAEGGGTAARASGVGPSDDDLIGRSNSDKKRKRTLAFDESEVALIANMTDSVNNVASAILSTAHTEVHPDLENSVMDLPGFSEDQLDLVLSHLTKDKAESLVYIQKNEARRARWFKKFLEKHHPDSI